MLVGILLQIGHAEFKAKALGRGTPGKEKGIMKSGGDDDLVLVLAEG